MGDTRTNGSSSLPRLKSRVEINFNRLIVRCEEMALDTENVTNPENWRLEKVTQTDTDTKSIPGSF